jgi:hypothetical protein
MQTMSFDLHGGKKAMMFDSTASHLLLNQQKGVANFNGCHTFYS